MAYDQLNENLRRARRAQGFTQEQVANALGIDRSSYTYYETGKTEPNLDTLVKLARMFQVGLEDLLVPEETAEAAALRDSQLKESLMMEALSLDEHKLILNYRSMSETRKKALLELLGIR